jgi:hypothetical protein
MVLGWALALIINQYYQLRIPIFSSAFLSFLPALLIYLIDINRKNAITYLAIASIIPILALIFWIRKFNPFLWLKKFTGWVIAFDGTEELYSLKFAIFTMILVSLLGVCLFFILTRRQMLKVVLAIVIFASLIILSVNKYEISKAVVCISVFYILTILVECYGIIYTQKAGKQEKKESILYLAPICLMIAILAISFPSKKEPIQWTIVKTTYKNVVRQIEDWRMDLDYYFGNHPSEFGLSLTGYSENKGELNNNGRTLIKDSKVALKISGCSTNRAIYLIGSVSGIYTGSSWEKCTEESLPDEQEYKLDFMELSYALSRQDKEVLEKNKFLNQVMFKVKYDNIKTKTLFYPLKSCYFIPWGDTKEPLTDKPNIVFNKVTGRGTTYETTFYEMNLKGDAFVNMLREAEDFSYDNAPGVKLDSLEYLNKGLLSLGKSLHFESRWDFYEVLRDRAELIQRNYTQLPDTLPHRVKKLAEEITASYDTKYDKLKAIEAYLTQYEYSLSPGKVPEGEDFVDYFLFENKKGYCTSYATAMAVMGRCIGIPTRYMEGFIAKFDNRDKQGMYPVKNSQAHAWAEAYIEGVGWIPFEATAPYYQTRYLTWAEAVAPATPEIPEQYRNHYEGEIDASGLPIIRDKEPKPVKKVEKADEVMYGIIVAFATVFILLSLLVIYYNSLKLRYRKQYRKADSSKKMYMIFLRILALLKQEGFGLEEQETIQMLAERVKDHYLFNKVLFFDVAKIYMRYRYADEAVTEKELEKVILFQEGLSKIQREKNALVKLWLKEFVFLMKYRNA